MCISCLNPDYLKYLQTNFSLQTFFSFHNLQATGGGPMTKVDNTILRH